MAVPLPDDTLVYAMRSLVLGNRDFRRVLIRTPQLEVTAYHLQKDQVLDKEVHRDKTQMVYVLQGRLRLWVEGRSRIVEVGEAAVIQANREHEITCLEDAKFFSVYSPPEHAAGTVHQTKRDSLAADDSRAF